MNHPGPALHGAPARPVRRTARRRPRRDGRRRADPPRRAGPVRRAPATMPRGLGAIFGWDRLSATVSAPIPDPGPPHPGSTATTPNSTRLATRHHPELDPPGHPPPPRTRPAWPPGSTAARPGLTTPAPPPPLRAPPGLATRLYRPPQPSLARLLRLYRTSRARPATPAPPPPPRPPGLPDRRLHRHHRRPPMPDHRGHPGPRPFHQPDSTATTPGECDAPRPPDHPGSTPDRVRPGYAPTPTPPASIPRPALPSPPPTQLLAAHDGAWKRSHTAMRR